MASSFPNSKIKGKPASSPNAPVRRAPKPAYSDCLPPQPLGQCCPPHCPPQPGPFPGQQRALPGPRGPARSGTLLLEQRPFERPLEPDFGPLGIPLNIAEVARLIGCSPWTVRQTLIPRGLPHFRFKSSGTLTFYQSQVIRWIESQQQGGKTTK